MMMRFARILAPIAILLGMAAAPARAETRVTPYIEAAQVLTADLKNGGDVLTYTQLSAGVDASVRNRRTEVQISYRFDYRIGWDDNSGDETVHTGLARGTFRITPELSFDAGAFATRSRVDVRGAAPPPLIGSPDNVTQIYSAYAGPTLSTRVGDLDVGALYRIGYTKAESSTRLRLPGGQPLLDVYDDATAHLLTGSVGQRPGPLPFGWKVSAGYQREEAGQLDQRFESSFLRYDVTVPVSSTLALVGGVGYEDIEISQRDALRNPDGTPVIGRGGRFVTDPASPRRLAYDIDGLIYDAGVLWKPSRRTQLEARVGKRYGGTTFFGNFTHQLSPASGVQVVVYDGIQSFGRLLTDNISRLPTSFQPPRNPLTGGLDGCVIGTAPGTGGCFDDVLQSVSTANFRHRGVSALYSASRGPLSLGFGLGYSQRKYHAPRFGDAFSLDGVKDENWYAHAQGRYLLDAESGIDAVAYLNRYDSGIPFSPDVTGAGATVSYFRDFTERLTGTAAVGLYAYDQKGFDSSLIGSALVAVRYSF